MNANAASPISNKSRSKRPELAIDWYPQQLPADTEVRNVPMRTSDGAAVNGTLYMRGRPTSVVCLMHPREFLGCHYLVPNLLAGGVAVWAQGARSVGNDLRLEHEQAVLDVAAGLDYLRAEDFRKIILLGNSGGAGLFTYYLQQAQLAPAARLAISPTGRLTGFESVSMPSVDAMIYLAPHPGQGRLLMRCIDPSVASEVEALSVVPGLDPFNPDNGYVAERGKSRFAPEFISRYRAAQHARVQRIDESARELIERRQRARKTLKAGDSDRQTQLLAAHTPIMAVWRTDADLRCLDLSIDPSDRKPGSLWSPDMFVSNYGAVGFGRLCTPESWLSTWSGISSRAALELTAPSVNIPVLIAEYTGDQTTFPADYQQIMAWLGTTDKTYVRVPGDHHGRPLVPEQEPGRYRAGREIVSWLEAKNFV